MEKPEQMTDSPWVFQVLTADGSYMDRRAPEGRPLRLDPGESVVYYSNDNGKNWYPYGENLTGYQTKDSGKREEMPTGSVRDTREGKGRFELISPFALARIAGVYERGAVKYASRNWEKGQPFSRFLDSALRHLNRFSMGWTDEDHLSQAAWNILAIIHFQELGKTELDDMPHYQSGPKEH